MKRGLVLLSLLATAASQDDRYNPSPEQVKVDRSFSDIPVQTPLRQVRNRLKEERVQACHRAGECDWLDRNGVRHYFWGDRPQSLWVVIKSIRAPDFVGRSIPALGIGMARTKSETLAAARKFAPKLKFDCQRGSKTGKTNVRSFCGATMKPGWVTLEFDGRDRLTEVRFDGYNFT